MLKLFRYVKKFSKIVNSTRDYLISCLDALFHLHLKVAFAFLNVSDCFKRATETPDDRNIYENLRGLFK